tara:strand:- start:6838 stop:7632 length:795 start_codon:yes stop_codon:yes gene_type:complete
MMLKMIFSALLAITLSACVAVPEGKHEASAAIPARGQILVIMTNHSAYPSRADTTGLWLTELTHFLDIVEAGGYSTVFASPKGGKVPLDERSLGWLYMDAAARRHLESPAFRARLENSLPVADIDPAQFEAIYFTGGHGVMWDFPDNPELRRVAESIYAQGGVVSAVCHGVAGLLGLRDAQGRDLLEGRRVTGFSNREELFSGMQSQVPFFLEDRLVAQGARYEKPWLPFTAYAVTDGRIVTGQNPQSAKVVAEALLKRLAARP